MKRRAFVKKSALSAAGVLASTRFDGLSATEVTVLNPKNRVPVSFIIDDSTALVNLAYYGIPQFKEVFPEQYLQDWRNYPGRSRIPLCWSFSSGAIVTVSKANTAWYPTPPVRDGCTGLFRDGPGKSWKKASGLCGTWHNPTGISTAR